MCRPCKWQVVHETVGELSIRSRASNHPSYEHSSPRRMWRNWRPLSVAVEKIATKNLGADQSQETTAENEFVAIWQWLLSQKQQSEAADSMICVQRGWQTGTICIHLLSYTPPAQFVVWGCSKPSSMPNSTCAHSGGPVAGNLWSAMVTGGWCKHRKKSFLHWIGPRKILQETSTFNRTTSCFLQVFP